MLLPHTIARCGEAEEALQIMIKDERNNNVTMTPTKLFHKRERRLPTINKQEQLVARAYLFLLSDT